MRSVTTPLLVRVMFALDLRIGYLGKHNATLFLPAPYRLKGKRPEDWVKLKNDYMAKVIAEWRRYATNLTEEPAPKPSRS